MRKYVHLMHTTFTNKYNYLKGPYMLKFIINKLHTNTQAKSQIKMISSNLSSRRVSHQKPVEDLEKKQINASPSEKSAIPTE